MPYIRPFVTVDNCLLLFVPLPLDPPPVPTSPSSVSGATAASKKHFTEITATSATQQGITCSIPCQAINYTCACTPFSVVYIYRVYACCMYPHVQSSDIFAY